MEVWKAMCERRSTRAFAPRPVARDLLLEILRAAQHSPSNCNVQPWQVIVVSDSAKDLLKQKLITHITAGHPPRPDFGPSVMPDYEGIHRERQHELAASLYSALGIERGDKVGRSKASLRNWNFFDAPHVALFTMDRALGFMGAVDVGIYAHGLALLMTANGIATCLQASLGYFPEPIRECIEMPDRLGILFGMSFGYADESAAANRVRSKRGSTEEAVRFIDSLS
jgi:nitroreductase